ncbi:MAG TPA: DUF4878 domain-containing protein [Chitinophagaceae bacterium]|nr:DUF4878 domain-containing protein [Chitinophagaceae bacterium]
MNKPFYFILLLSVFVLSSCSGNNKSTDADDDLNVANKFIRAALDGKYNEARKFMLSDSTNTNFLDVAERNYQRLDLDTKAGYRMASINIFKVQPVNDSTTIFIYSNSYKNDHDSLKIVKKNNIWLVDLKYLYQHDLNTLTNNIPQSDNLK